jgi:hypothetical protein
MHPDGHESAVWSRATTLAQRESFVMSVKVDFMMSWQKWVWTQCLQRHPTARSGSCFRIEESSPLQRARALCTVGCIHATLGDGDAARRALFDGLGEQQRVTRDAGLPDLLEMIAATHAVESVAPQSLGAAAALRERSNIPLLPFDRRQVECRHADVRVRHPEAAFDRALMLGRALARDDAIQVVLALQQGA